MRYASTQNFTDSAKGQRVEIDGMAGQILTIFNDVYCHRLSPFHHVDFEWYERPYILRYPEGSSHSQQSDAEQWRPEDKKWVRAADRDYNVFLCLNDNFGGGELLFTDQNYRIKPRAGTLIAFPSDHRYLHAVLPVSSGVRYVLASWAAALSTPRVRPLTPYAAVFLRQKRLTPHS